jgi:hypothetical protein
MLLPSGIGNVPTLNVCLDVWDCIESYTICMLLACRLKIILSPYHRLLISFLVLPLVLLPRYQSLLFVASMRHAQFTSSVYLRLAIRPSAGEYLSPIRSLKYLHLPNGVILAQRSWLFIIKFKRIVLHTNVKFCEKLVPRVLV